MKYSESSGGFYLPAIHGDNIPAGAVDITDELYAALLAGQEQGKQIVAGPDGQPMLITPTQPPKTIFVPRDYLKRFTMAEYGAARSGSIQVQYALDNLIGAQFVDLADPDVAAGLDAMIAAGIIDAARKAELLAPDPA